MGNCSLEYWTTIDIYGRNVLCIHRGTSRFSFELRHNCQNIFVLHELINHMINSSKQFNCAFIDHTKAFYYINREFMANIVKTWLKRLHSGHFQVNVSFHWVWSKTWNSFQSSLCVRQGECLSPFIFYVFIGY